MYTQEQSIDALTHKLYHAGVGAASGAVLAGGKGAVAGALGAVVAETVAEAMQPAQAAERLVAKRRLDKGSRITAEEITAARLAAVSSTTDVAKVSTAVATLFAGLDVATALTTATTALEHNTMRSTMQLLQAQDERGLCLFEDYADEDELGVGAAVASGMATRHDRELNARLEGLKLRGGSGAAGVEGGAVSVAATTQQNPGILRKLAGHLGRNAHTFVARNETARELLQMAELAGTASMHVAVYGTSRLSGDTHQQAMHNVQKFEAGIGHLGQRFVQKYNLSADELTGFALLASATGAGSVAVRPALRFSGSVLRGSGKLVTQTAKEASPLGVKLTRQRLTQYLEHILEVPREQLIKDIESIGLKYAEGSTTSGKLDGKFIKFKHKTANIRVEIHEAHPVKRRNAAKYPHIHIMDKQGNALNKKLVPVHYHSQEAHIQIKEFANLIMELKPK